MKILVTGAAGFIGFHFCRRLLRESHQVVGIDNLNSYYDVKLKEERLEVLRREENFSFHQMALEDSKSIADLFNREKFEVAVHLAAQAGVRYSLKNPHAYVGSNVVGFLNILEGCRHCEVGHLIYASSSSVYGLNTKMPFAVHDNVDHPVSLYAATKKANELMAHSYSHLYQLPTTGLRFFTVYGPWGRPDMAYFKFAELIMSGSPIDVYNYGKCRRDFTYIDDIVEGMVRLLDQPAQANLEWDAAAPDPSTSCNPYRIYNIGNHQPVELMKFIEILEDCLGKEAEKNLQPPAPGDVEATYADIDDLTRAVGFEPKTSLEEGLKKFVAWYLPWREKRQQG